MTALVSLFWAYDQTHKFLLCSIFSDSLSYKVQKVWPHEEECIDFVS